MPDAYSLRTRRPADPAVSLVEVTPDDAADLPRVSLALNVATAGRVRVTTLDGSVSDVTIEPGHAFPLRVRRVWSTGTTATGIRALT